MTDKRTTRIDSLELSRRMVNALHRLGIFTLGDAAEAGRARLFGDGVGPETGRQIAWALDLHGIEHDIPKNSVKRYD